MIVTNKQRRPPKDIRRDQLRKVAKRAGKAAQKQVLDKLCSKIVNTRKRSGNGRIPYGLVSTLVGETSLLLDQSGLDYESLSFSL